MRKTEQKGITLIALVITIIVLLILAGVAISMLAGDNGILKQAAEAKERTEEKTTEEQVKLAAMDALMRGDDYTSIEDKDDLSTALTAQGLTISEEDIGGNPTDGFIVTVKGTTYKVASNGTVREATAIDKLPTIEAGEYASVKSKYIDTNKQVAVIPAGFTVSDVSTEKTIKSGLVIYEGDISAVEDMTTKQATNDQFVWVPVDDITTMYETLEDGTKVGQLYNWDSLDTNGNPNKIQYSENGYREPAVLYNEDKGIDDSEYGLSLSDLQKEFDDMIKYVGESNGFYVGRYETSLDATTKEVQSIKGVTPAKASDTETEMWYGLYNKQKTYKNSNVVSSMIWGSQYDQMMIWMTDNDYTVTSRTPKAGVSYNNTATTGKENNTDVMNNIHDLIGCYFEWTLEALDTFRRVSRGGYYYRDNSLFSPSYRSPSSSIASNSNGNNGSRLTLYVK